MTTPKEKTYRKTMTAIHVAVWLIVFIAPLTFFDRDDRFEMDKLVPMVSSPLMMMVVFYTMYLYVTPRYLFRQDKRKFWLYTVLIIAGAGLALHLWLTFSHSLFFSHDCAAEQARRAAEHTMRKMGGRGMHHRRAHMEIWFMLRNTFNMAVTGAIATMTVITLRWNKTEAARQKAELARQQADLARQDAELARQKADAARTAAELKNLRNQINPHFLLNTLNNIYALTAFNQEKAQEAIVELSGMLRHLLYDNQQEFVNLADEVAFIRSYVNLMKIRVAKTCDIRVEVNVPEPCRVRVAPLIFISLIENAFKHGIAASGQSFIHISLEADDTHIACNIENSNHPKNETDRSGHGIGLEQVTKRLELSYGGKYSWEKGVRENSNIYFSKIIIYDTKLRNN